MRVDGVFFLKGRGHVATVTVQDPDEVRRGDELCRADGATWTVVSVDRPLCRAPLFPRSSVSLGLLLSDEEWDIAEGDEVTVQRSTNATDTEG